MVERILEEAENYDQGLYFLFYFLYYIYFFNNDFQYQVRSIICFLCSYFVCVLRLLCMYVISGLPSSPVPNYLYGKYLTKNNVIFIIILLI